MSFANDVKNELCRVPLSRHCCAVAEAYGVLLYCHTFTTREIRIVTASPSPSGCRSCFAARSARTLPCPPPKRPAAAMC